MVRFFNIVNKIMKILNIADREREENESCSNFLKSTLISSSENPLKGRQLVFCLHSLHINLSFFKSDFSRVELVFNRGIFPLENTMSLQYSISYRE